MYEHLRNAFQMELLSLNPEVLKPVLSALDLFVSERKPHRQLQKPALEARIRKLVERSGVGKHITPHNFRHTTATTMLISGVDIGTISKMLGHENIATTMIYAHQSDSDVRRTHAKSVV